MNNETGIPGAFVRALSISTLFLSSAALAAPPHDNWYAGGPDGVSIDESMSETWHLKGQSDHTSHVKLKGEKFTLRKHGSQWFLVPGTALQWTPAHILLEDHPDFVPWGSSAQWRWTSKNPVMIRDPDSPEPRHLHDVCIGFPEPKPRRDEEVLCVGIVDHSGEKKCEDCTQVHPGHSTADR